VRLLAVDRLVQMAVKKGVLHVQLMYVPGARSGDAEDDADGSRFNNRTECLVVVDVVLLRKTTNDPPGFMASERAISTILVLEDPLAGDDVGTRQSGYEAPCAIIHERLVFIGHRCVPVWIGQSSAGVGGQRRGRGRCRRREAVALDRRRQGARPGVSLPRRSWCLRHLLVRLLRKSRGRRDRRRRRRWTRPSRVDAQRLLATTGVLLRVDSNRSAGGGSRSGSLLGQPIGSAVPQDGRVQPNWVAGVIQGSRLLNVRGGRSRRGEDVLQQKIKIIRSRLGSHKRKVSLIENDVSRDDDLVIGEVETRVALLGRRVTEEDTPWNEEIIFGESWH